MPNRAKTKSLDVHDPSLLVDNDKNEFLGHFGNTAKVFLENTNDMKKPDCGQEVFDLEMELLKIKKVPALYNLDTFEGYSGAYQQTGFDPFSSMIPNGFVVIGNPDWYIPDNFVSYINSKKQTQLSWVEVKGSRWIKSMDIHYMKSFQEKLDNWNLMIEKAGKYSIKARAPINFYIALYPYAESSWYRARDEQTVWEPTEKLVDEGHWFTLAQLIDKFENDYMYEEELQEKYPFHKKEMTELGYENYSDRKFKRRINL
tara:strand:- start:9310 stop:10083 length:774 start_codon:yes stop_codon:yes gene_type:complete